MNRLVRRCLKQYDPEDRELYLKAGFVLVTTLLVIVCLTGIVFYTYFLAGVASKVIVTELTGFVVILFALRQLIKGRYDIAIHIILISGFSMIWTVLFIESNFTLITKLDTIVFVPALLAAMPLMMFRNRRPMVVYFLINMILFGLFNYHIGQIADLTFRDRLDYFFDNLVAMVFVFFVSFTLFSIYRQVLRSLKNELAERKQAEKRLQESENRLSVHLLNTPVGAISWDLDFKVVEWNPAAEKIFEYTKAEAYGRHAADLILPPDVAEMVDDIFQNLLSQTGGERSVNENVTRSGKRILCDWYNTVIKDNQDRIIGVASLVNDITELKKTQEMMIQTEKMMSVGGLAAGMAHEINNPLAGMIQNAQVIRNRLTEDLPANLKTAKELDIPMDGIRRYMEMRGIPEQLNNIGAAGQRAARIISNMLSFSRKSGSEREKTDLAELMDATVELAQNDYDLTKQFDFKNIQITKKYAADILPVFCEKSKIQQVLFNLLKNASQAMGEKQNRIRPRITIRIANEGAAVRIEIEDNGPGMDESVRKRIFEPFFTTKSVDKGTGLGLSVSYFIIVDDHGGEMHVESEPGQGARFIIKLPLRSEQTA
jgi:PAS domain S-box-containing protein